MSHLKPRVREEEVEALALCGRRWDDLRVVRLVAQPPRLGALRSLIAELHREHDGEEDEATQARRDQDGGEGDV